MLSRADLKLCAFAVQSLGQKGAVCQFWRGEGVTHQGQLVFIEVSLLGAFLMVSIYR